MTKVSVIVPVFNAGPYLRRCLDSLLAQTLGEIEIICIDDGSTDGSGGILDACAARDGRLRVAHRSHAGAGAARNAGLDLATGEYLFFCDADDFAAPEMLERLYARAAAQDADAVLTGRIFSSRRFGQRIPVRASAVFGKAGCAFAGRDFPDDLFVAARTPLWDKLFRRSFVAERGICFQEVSHSNDLFFAMSALAEAGRIVTDDGAYYTHCASHAGSLQNTKAKAPLALLEAYDGLERRLAERGLRPCFGVGLCRLLLRCGIREIVRFGDPAVRSVFYDGFRTRFLRAASAAGLDSAAGASRWERRFARTIAEESHGAFWRASRSRRQMLRILRMLRFLCGMRIEEVW